VYDSVYNKHPSVRCSGTIAAHFLELSELFLKYEVDTRHRLFFTVS